jgi:predicted dehydrogenase/threonine dehydrogenase-like Zn-dependent dehydrogenase
MSIGYSSAGEVIAVGSSVIEFRVGDRVACAGGGFAVHAEVVRIPRTLAAIIPQVHEDTQRNAISYEEAAFAAVGSVALHALRLAAPQVGETIAVIGLGLIGLLAIQLARCSGCHVIGMDPDRNRQLLAMRLGCDAIADEEEEMISLIAEHTNGSGADSILVAAATKSSAPLELAGRIARDRATVIAIGTTGMEIPRKLFYEKELQFRVSRSYGPGRYDQNYERDGRDYPQGYVRWTEGRNLQAFLDLMSQNKIQVDPLISHRFPVSLAAEAYQLLTKSEVALGMVIEYPGHKELQSTITNRFRESTRVPASRVRLGLLGAGNFALTTLLPVIRKTGNSDLIAACSASGLSAAHAARKFGFVKATSDPDELLHDPDINTVVIATRHHLHASQVISALTAGKNVFCEKPLCLNDGELLEIAAVYQASAAMGSPVLMLGFNRRFAPLAIELKKFLSDIHEPLVMNYRVNAGALSPKHWVQDPEQGGGRVIGEVCHFVDLMTFICGSTPIQVFATSTSAGRTHPADNLTMQVSFENGSTGVITYIANGDRSGSKERLEVFGQGRMAVLDDFRRLELFRNGTRRYLRGKLRTDKGHMAEWKAFIHAVQTGAPAPIPVAAIFATTAATFRIMDSLQSRQPEIVRIADQTEPQ